MVREERGSTTITEAAQQFLSQSLPDKAEAQGEINKFVRWVGGSRKFGTLSSHEVATYVDHLGNSTTELARRIEPVKAFLAFAKKEGYTGTNLGVNLRLKKALQSSGSKKKEQQTVQVERAYLTEEGYQNLVAELESLKGQRPLIAEELRLAMADKDFRENAPLDAARDRQAHVEARIRELEALMKRAEVMSSQNGDTVLRANLGSTVVISDQSGEQLRLTLVHPHEANPSLGKVSVASPMGKAIVGRSSGEEIAVAAPAGTIHYKLESVEPGT